MIDVRTRWALGVIFFIWTITISAAVVYGLQ